MAFPVPLLVSATPCLRSALFQPQVWICALCAHCVFSDLTVVTLSVLYILMIASVLASLSLPCVLIVLCVSWCLLVLSVRLLDCYAFSHCFAVVTVPEVSAEGPLLEIISAPICAGSFGLRQGPDACSPRGDDAEESLGVLSMLLYV